MKLTEIVSNILLNAGLCGKMDKFETTIDIPQDSGEKITITIKADNLQICLDKDSHKL